MRFSNYWRNRSRYEKCLLCLFLLTVPLLNPWVRGDGVGYYAYARSLLIEGQLDFKKDWLAANSTFRMGRVDSQGEILPDQYTRTGHLDNHFTVGPAILWLPFLIPVHLGVKLGDALGAGVAGDGFSWPYVTAMALGTAAYGFLALWLSFQVARKFVADRWAFLATLGIWFASSLPVYLYFNPSWSHAHSAFVVALFVWYWERTRNNRTLPQTVGLGLIAGLMIDVYYPNAILLMLPLTELIRACWQVVRRSTPEGQGIVRLLETQSLFAGAILAAVLPTLFSRWIIYGSVLSSGYVKVSVWNWRSPALASVLFSSDHGLFSWTPILAPACVGMLLFWRRERWLGGALLLTLVVFYYFIASYPDWDGISSFGNRFFVSLTVLFTLGLAVFLDSLAHIWRERAATVVAGIGTAVLVAWNLGLIFQWGTHLIPARGPVSWHEAAYNEVVVVPPSAVRALAAYLTRRTQMMRHIEQEDLKQLKSATPEGTE
jgi:hypothetical protein